MFKLSIIVPVYNEENTIKTVLLKLLSVPLLPGISREIIVVNDCSTDNTEANILALTNSPEGKGIEYFKHEKNRGKGAALRTGIASATGDYILVHDADFEYDPREIVLLLEPVVEGHADVVYGSRFIGGRAHRILFFWHTIGNKFLTFLSNMFSDMNLTDMETCYKLFRADILKNINLVENRFGFEPEVTAKLGRVKNIRIYEVGISYYGRTYDEGKKINWKDGFRAIWCILKYGLLRRD